MEEKGAPIDLLILGHNGMLGKMVYRYFNSPKYRLHCTEERFDLKDPYKFADSVQTFHKDTKIFIINCIGAIPQKKPTDDEYIIINMLLPELMAKGLQENQFLINPSTDCIKDRYSNYGLSKFVAMQCLKKYPRAVSTLCSIIGPYSEYGLMGWFLSQEKDATIQGYSNHYWNGVTTLHWCELVEQKIIQAETFPTETLVFGSERQTKYEMLEKFRLIFDRKDVDIQIKETEKAVDRVVEGIVIEKSFTKQLEELKAFMKM